MEPLNEYFLEIEFRLKEDKGLLKAGHLIAWEQLPIVNYATIKKDLKPEQITYLDQVASFKSFNTNLKSNTFNTEFFGIFNI